ncbi:MAG TPA: hypothetical protein PLX69_18010 [Leptospiraceae bacterium]|nr:hypothetical protein [Leptospiraceae bacterium]HRG76460.1 hypothetical protein [Leptospiraceae bacterium]
MAKNKTKLLFFLISLAFLDGRCLQQERSVSLLKCPAGFTSIAEVCWENSPAIEMNWSASLYCKEQNLHIPSLAEWESFYKFNGDKMHLAETEYFWTSSEKRDGDYILFSPLTGKVYEGYVSPGSLHPVKCVGSSQEVAQLILPAEKEEVKEEKVPSKSTKDKKPFFENYGDNLELKNGTRLENVHTKVNRDTVQAFFKDGSAKTILKKEIKSLIRTR